MRISMIVAVGENGAIGKNNDLLWHLPDDMKFFKETTTGHVIITGRKSYESIPVKWRPLPLRTNIILTTNKAIEYEGALVMHKLEDAITYAREKGEEEVFIIGGGQIYQLGLNIADRLYLTEVKASFEAEVFFPAFSKDEWVEIERRNHPKDDKHAHNFDFVIYDRRIKEVDGKS